MQWEYKTVKIETKGWMGGIVDTKELDDLLNVYGIDEWELVTSVVTSQGQGYSRELVCIMKRELKR